MVAEWIGEAFYLVEGEHLLTLLCWEQTFCL